MLLRLLRFLFGISPPKAPREIPSSLQGRDLTGIPGSTQSGSSTSLSAGTGRSAADGLSGLNTDRFRPQPSTDLMSLGRMTDWRFSTADKRGVIPSEELPRVQAIDQAMVGMGLITETELARIHDIGRTMAPLLNTAAFIQSAGTHAVKESREERQRRKAEKKETARLKQIAHLEQVQHRKATDIVFLGRGVSRGLADRRANIEKLQTAGLPVLSCPSDVANAMGLTVSRLRWLAFHSEAPTRVHYVSFEIPKKSGGTRRLSAPHRQLAAAQHWILTRVLNLVPVHENAHGFVTQRSVVTNASPHVNSEIVINADLKDFFPSITFARVDGLFRSLGYSPAVATILALLCTECPRQTVQMQGTTYFAATGPRVLPQGACTSPAISNRIAHKLDRRMSAMAHKLGWHYTRYADDITWSAADSSDIAVGYVLARIRHIAEDEGFELNHAKTRVQRRSQQQSVTGVVVNDQLGVARESVRTIRAILHNAERTGLAEQNRNQHPQFESWLTGMIGWISMVNPEQGQKLRQHFDKVRGS